MRDELKAIMEPIKSYFQSKKEATALIIFSITLHVPIFFYLFKTGYILLPDSKSYINNSIVRTPLYPIFLDLFEFLFGSYYLLPVVYFQILASFLASYILSNTLRKYLGFGRYLYLFIYLTLLFPIYSPFHIANQILTESLAYISLIITINYLVVYIFGKKIKYLIYFLVFSVITSAIRPQFIFLYGISFVVILYHIYKTKNIKQSTILFIILFIIIFLSSIFERTYNYIHHGFFIKIPFTGIQFITPQLYLTDKEDLKLFQNYSEDNRKFLEKVYSDIEEKKINYKHNKTQNLFSHAYFLHFHDVYNEISWSVVVENYAMIKGKGGRLTSKQFIELDDLTISVGLKLLTKNYLRFLKLYISNILAGIGGFISFFLLCILTLVFFILFVRTKDELYFLFFIIHILGFANSMFVALVEPVMNRYSFYTDILQIVFGIIFLSFIAVKIISNYYKLNPNYVWYSR